MKSLIPQFLSSAMIAASLLASGASLHAEQDNGEKLNAKGREIKTKTSEAAHNLEDKACEMVNGKMECAGKKLKHKMNDAADKAHDRVKTTQDKID